ncbi:glycosyltransferase [Sphingomonas sp. CJ20]
MTMPPERTAPPILSCLLAIHRYDRYVPIAIQSILDQSFTDFELLVLVNGDPAVADQVRADFADPRIIVSYSPVQQLGHNLNRGLEQARGTFIARMDGDDIATPTRFAEQLRRLQERPELVMVTCRARSIDAEGRDLPGRVGEPRWIDRRLWLKNPICHPAAMFRKQPVMAVGGYAAIVAQDYELWLRLDRRHGRNFYEVMPDCHLKFRDHALQTRGKTEGYAVSAGLLLREFVARRDARFLLGATLMVVRGLARPRPARNPNGQ